MGNECACGRNELEKAADSSLDFEKSTKNWIETEEQLNAHIREAIKVYFNETSDEDVKACAELLSHHHEDYEGMLTTAKKGSVSLNKTFAELHEKYKDLTSKKKAMEKAEEAKDAADKAQKDAEDKAKAAEAAEAKANAEEKTEAQKKTLNLKRIALEATEAKAQKEQDLKAKTQAHDKSLKSWQDNKKTILKTGFKDFFEQCKQVTSQQLDEFNAVLDMVNAIDGSNTSPGVAAAIASAPPDQKQTAGDVPATEASKEEEAVAKEDETKGGEQKAEEKEKVEKKDENPPQGKTD